jgi:hypothetical protein
LQQTNISCSKYARRRRVNNILYRNRNFNPYSHPARKLRIQSPVCHYMDENNQRKLVIQEVPERQLSMDDANDHEINEYYTEGATDLDNYIDSAFRSTRKNEAYIEENVVMNYAPVTVPGCTTLIGLIMASTLKAGSGYQSDTTLSVPSNPWALSIMGIIRAST